MDPKPYSNYEGPRWTSTTANTPPDLASLGGTSANPGHRQAVGASGNTASFWHFAGVLVHSMPEYFSSIKELIEYLSLFVNVVRVSLEAAIGPS